MSCAVSEQVEKLQLGDLRTKNYSNMAVVVVNVSSEKDTAKMIETFFKDLNPKYEVGVIPFTKLENKYLLREKERRGSSWRCMLSLRRRKSDIG